MHLLIVEDSITLGRVLEKYIKEMNHTATIVRSGEEALQHIESMPVDMILMDIEMPGLDGLETTKLIRESSDQWFPIIFVSGRSKEEDFSKGIEAGGDDYLIKPLSRVILQAKIKAMERILSMQNELNSLYKELESLHRYDSLTQIYNRGAFTEYANEVWSIVGRQGQHIAVLMMDVDHFKEFNDNYGHPAGDACLQKVGQALKNTLQRSGDLYGRYGGEEFIAVLSNIDYKGAQTIAEHIRLAVEDLKIPHGKSKTSRYVTISIGGSVIPQSHGNTLDETIKHADTVLYKAKKTGRNRAVVEEFLYRVRKNVLVLNADGESLLILSNVLKDKCQIVTADNSEEGFELIDAIKAEMIFIDVQNAQLKKSKHDRKLLAKIEELKLPLIYVSSNDGLTMKKNAYAELINISDESKLRAVVDRYFSE